VLHAGQKGAEQSIFSDNSWGGAGLKLYEEVAGKIEKRIIEGVYRYGDRLPSVRESSIALSVSMTTAYHAYNILESRGLIRAKPQSGYFVAGPKTATERGRDEVPSDRAKLDLEQTALEVLRASGHTAAAHFGEAYPDPKLFPQARLLALMRSVSRQASRYNPLGGGAAGVSDLRREIAKRYARRGHSVSPDDLIITLGAMDSVNLALSTLVRPGDAVAIDGASFFPMSFSLQRLGLKPVPIPFSPEHGLDLDVLEQVLASGRVKACLMMMNCHYPLGVTLSRDRRARLLSLVKRYETPLIENDAYAELLEPAEAGLSGDSERSGGYALNCSSLSNCLSPELRVGWVVAGRFRDRMLSVKFLTNMSSHWIAQQTAAEYLKYDNFDRHLRALRTVLHDRMSFGIDELSKPKWGSLVRRCSRARSGFMIWLELPPSIDSLRVYSDATQRGLGFVPGPLFSVDRVRSNEIALNVSFPWTDGAVRSLHQLMVLFASYAS
jgi:DNA-binding transcriptional MocR family regulator